MASQAQLSPRLRAWLDRGRFFSDRGSRVFYRDGGRGEPLLLLHGYPTASWGFHRMWPGLTERFRVVAPDLLGSGFSDKPPGGAYDIASLADQVERLLAALDLRRVHVLAHAYGVTTGQELLARHVERSGGGGEGLRLGSACFVNGGLFPEGTRPTPTQKLLLSPLGPWIARYAPQPYRAFRRKLARNFGPAHEPTEEELEDLWQVLRHNDGHRIVPRTLAYLRERWSQRERWVGALTAADVPLALLNGAADPVSGEHVPRIWRELLPERPLVELDPGIGHYPPLEAPEETLAAFTRFFTEHVAGSADRSPASG